MTADLIFTNAHVLTMDEANPRAEAVAVTGDTITAVGRAADITALTGKGTRVIDAKGATVMPGFIEGHMHLFSGAAELDHLHLTGVHGFEALSSAVKGYAAQHPEKKLLVAQGADYTILSEHEAVTRHHLDRIMPDRPFAMVSPDHHTAWANTAALERAGILKGRTLGPGNEIVMGADGLAAGELREGEAFQPVMALGGAGRERLGLSTGGEPDPAPTPAERAFDLETLKRGLDYCARHGITSIHNMDGNLYTLELLSEIEAEGGLKCRVRVPFHFKNFMDLAMLEKASLMAKRYASPTLASGFVKMFYDGVLEGYTAVMVDDYADRPGWKGEPLFTPERFAQVATEIDRRGLQIAVHAIGDGAVRAVLDGYEAAAKANGKRDSRHRIEHVEVIHPHDIPRFRELGVVASMQPPHPPGTMGLPLEPTVSRIGRHRWPVSYAWRTLREAGARLVFATDWPVSPIDPLASVQAAVTRETWAGDLPDQRQTLSEALASYTRDSAYTEFMDGRKGELKPGQCADLVMLDGDITAVTPDAIAALRPTMTVCAGRITYSS
jgi:hypothetical protein